MSQAGNLVDKPAARRGPSVAVSIGIPMLAATAILSEADVPVAEAGSMANLYSLFQMAAPMMYPLTDPPNYEPTPEDSVAGLAAAETLIGHTDHLSREIETRSQVAADLLIGRTDSLGREIEMRSQAAAELLGARSERLGKEIEALVAEDGDAPVRLA